MVQTIEGILEVDGSVRLLQPIQTTTPRRDGCTCSRRSRRSAVSLLGPDTIQSPSRPLSRRCHA